MSKQVFTVLCCLLVSGIAMAQGKSADHSKAAEHRKNAEHSKAADHRKNDEHNPLKDCEGKSGKELGECIKALKSKASEE